MDSILFGSVFFFLVAFSFCALLWWSETVSLANRVAHSHGVLAWERIQSLRHYRSAQFYMEGGTRSPIEGELIPVDECLPFEDSEYQISKLSESQSDVHGSTKYGVHSKVDDLYLVIKTNFHFDSFTQRKSFYHATENYEIKGGLQTPYTKDWRRYLLKSPRDD